jgi:tetratricopeptide (TPR) repeat protein
MKISFLTILCAFNFSLIFAQTISDHNQAMQTIREFEENGEFPQALDILQQLLEKDSLNATLWAEQARLYRLGQDYKKAITSYEKAIALNPSNHKLSLALARVYQITEIKEEAQNIYLKYLELYPENMMALNGMAEIYSTSGLTEQVINTYQKLHAIDNQNIEYLYKLAINQWNFGQQEESIIHFNKALALDSTYLPVVYDFAKILVKMRMHDTALEILEKNLKKYPKESALYAEAGYTYFSKNDYKNAIPYFEKAIDLGFSGYEAYRRLAISYYSVYEYEKSKKCFEMLIKKDTSDHRICLYLGHIYNTLGNPDKGLSFLNRSLKLITPDSMNIVTIYSGMANSHQMLNNFEEQINYINKRQQYLPGGYKSTRYLEEIALIYEYNIKNKAKAVQYYQKYYDFIKALDWISLETKNNLLAKIKQLQGELKARN